MPKIWRTTIGQLADAMTDVRKRMSDDVPVTVHGSDCVDIRVSDDLVELVGFHAHSKSEMKRIAAQGGIQSPMGGVDPWTGQPGDGFNAGD